MATLTTELDGGNQSARLTITGYTTYAHVRPITSGFEIELDDHLTGDKSVVSTVSDLQNGTLVAKTALLSKAQTDGIDTSGLDEVSD